VNGDRAPEDPRDDIGAYYERKRVAGNLAWARYWNHNKACDVCALDRPCKVARRLREAAIDAGDTGD
jgi:hypothetical protein